MYSRSEELYGKTWLVHRSCVLCERPAASFGLALDPELLQELECLTCKLEQPLGKLQLYT